MKTTFAVFFLFLTLVAGCSTSPKVPKLAVVIVIDQFPQYYLEKNASLFVDGGFKKLMTEGAEFTNANYSDAVTQTGPGHANISTGCNPQRHGIVANEWYDSMGTKIYCVECLKSREIESTGEKNRVSACPDHLMARGLGDRLKEGTGDSAKVWSISLKDRAAVLLGGKHPDGAIWFSEDSGEFISSSYYGTSLPTWCAEFNRARSVDSYFNQKWDHLLPLNEYRGCDADSTTYETGGTLGNTFPRKVNGGLTAPGKEYYEALECTPFGNDLVLSLAKKAVAGESLGTDLVPDILWISLSSNDYVGHAFGPNSHEVLDMIVRTDRQIADFLLYLDTTVGKNNYVVALSSDHGVAPAPESPFTKEHGGRIPCKAVKDSLNVILTTYMAQGFKEPIEFVKSVSIPYVYLNPQMIANFRGYMSVASGRTVLGLRRTKGVETAYPTFDLSSVQNIIDRDLQSRVLRNYYEGRSSQVYMKVKRGWVDTEDCTTHGTTYDYDTHVPLIFCGAPFKAGVCDVAADPCDISATLAPVLGLSSLENVDGHIRAEGLKKPPVNPTP